MNVDSLVENVGVGSCSRKLPVPLEGGLKRDSRMFPFFVLSPSGWAVPASLETFKRNIFWDYWSCGPRVGSGTDFSFPSSSKLLIDPAELRDFVSFHHLISVALYWLVDLNSDHFQTSSGIL